MWSNDESSSLISAVETQVLTSIPITSTNDNHEFSGSLVDIARDWNRIAHKLNRSGELKTKRHLWILLTRNPFRFAGICLMAIYFLLLL